MNKNMRTLLGLLLVLAMVLSLAACGTDPENHDKKDEEHPDMVYTADVIRLNAPELEEDGIRPAAYTDDGFYGLNYGKIADGEVPEGATVEYEGQYDVYGYRVYFVSYDGAVRELTGYTPLPASPDPGNLVGFYSGTNLEKLIVLEDGSLLAIENKYTGWFDGTEAEMLYGGENTWTKYRYQQEYYLRKLDQDAAPLEEVKLDFDNPESWLDFSSAVIDSEGRLVVVGDQTLYVFKADGSLDFQIQNDVWPNCLLRLRDGSIAVPAWDDSGVGLALYPVDMERKVFGKAVPIPDNAYNPLPGDENYDFYYVNGMYLYGYSLEKQEEVKILNWLDCDINGDLIQGLQVNEDGSIVGVLNQWKNDGVTTEIIRLHQVPYDSVPHKQELTMAVMYAYDIYDRVIDFNRHNDQVRIKIVDYSEFNDNENGDYDAGRTKLLTEMMSGQMPDIVALNQLPYSQLAAKGLLVDLYPYLEADAELKREDFFPNVLQALEVNGGLYMVTPSFNVSTLIGARSVVGDKPGWTYQDLRNALATMPAGCDPMDMYVTRSDILQTLLYADMDHYVNWTTGECSFDTQDFVELLEFVKQFPAEIPDDMEWESAATRIAAGRQMLTTAYLYSVDSMMWNDAQFGPGGCTYIGYPTNNGVGSVMQLDSGYGITSACRNKEAAWEFLRSFLLEEAQDQVWGIPVSLKAYQKKLEAAMTPEYQQDANGNYVLDANGQKIELSRGGYVMEDGTEYYFYAMTQEQADKLWEAVTTCTKVVNMDTSIYEIVNEQAQAYFSGQKTAAEVARLIQSRVNIYVNEQR